MTTLAIALIIYIAMIVVSTAAVSVLSNYDNKPITSDVLRFILWTVLVQPLGIILWIGFATSIGLQIRKARKDDDAF